MLGEELADDESATAEDIIASYKLGDSVMNGFKNEAGEDENI